MDDVYKTQQDKFFDWIVYIFIMAVVSGLWVWVVMNLQTNTYFSNSVAAALLVGMITTSAGVIIVIFTSKLFYGWLEDKLEENRLRRKLIKQQKTQQYQQQFSMVNGVVPPANPYSEIVEMMKQFKEMQENKKDDTEKDEPQLVDTVGFDISKLQ